MCIQKLNREASSQPWQSFVDYVGVFFQELRRQKYRLLNIDSIPAHRQEKFHQLISAGRDKGDSLLQNSGDAGQFSVILPPGSQCSGCGQDLSGLTPQLQLQFPTTLLGADLSIQVKPGHWTTPCQLCILGERGDETPRQTNTSLRLASFHHLLWRKGRRGSHL